MGSVDYHARDLADVRLEMQHGNTRLLSRMLQPFDVRNVKLPGSIYRLDGVKANLVTISAPAGMKVTAYVTRNVFLILHGTPAQLGLLPGLQVIEQQGLIHRAAVLSVRHYPVSARRKTAMSAGLYPLVFSK